VGKRPPTEHQKQIRFLLVLFGTVMILLVGIAIYFFNRISIPGR